MSQFRRFLVVFLAALALSGCDKGSADNSGSASTQSAGGGP
jgi:hypothetical protein